MMAPGSPSASPPISRANVSAAAQARVASDSSTSATSDVARKEAACSQHKVEFEKLIERGVVGMNSYVETEKSISTLLRLTSGILQAPSDPAKRSIKAKSKVLQTSVLQVKGGQDLLVALGFRHKVENFEEIWFFEPSASSSAKAVLSPMEILEIGQNIMERKLGLIQTRAATVRQAALTKKEEDGRIRREQLALIENDREQVRLRAERESAARLRQQQSQKAPAVHTQKTRQGRSSFDKLEDDNDEDMSSRVLGGGDGSSERGGE